MSCDYQRGEYWRYLKNWYQRHFPELLEDLVMKMAEAALEELLEKLTISDSSKDSLRKKLQRDPVETSIEIAFRIAKQDASSRKKRWTPEERRQLAEKTLKLLQCIRKMGVPDGVDPVHSKTGLPRISSQAAYAAIYDMLVELGICIDSHFVAIYETIEGRTNLSGEERHTISQHVKQIETQLQDNRSTVAIVNATVAIYATAPDILNLIIEALGEPDAKISKPTKRVSLKA
jgi:hypothetical protein